MPVVMVTAVHDISVALAALRNGAYDYLLKPFESAISCWRRLAAPSKTAGSSWKTGPIQTNLESLVEARTRPVADRHGQSGALLPEHHA